jgi:hypothetical protein
MQLFSREGNVQPAPSYMKNLDKLGLMPMKHLNAAETDAC